MSYSFMHKARNFRKSPRSCFREEVRHVVLRAYEFDTNLTALDVITMFEESNVKVLVFTRSFRVV